jgi:hypothetical protein
VLVVSMPASFSAERRYVLDYILTDRLGLHFESVIAPVAETTITRSDGKSLTIPDVLFLGPDRSTTEIRCTPTMTARHLSFGPIYNSKECAPDVVAMFAESDVEVAAVLVEPNKIRLSFDLLGAAFFMLTRLEEATSLEMDGHGRFPSAKSFVVRNNLVLRPIVDENVEFLRACLERLWPGSTTLSNEYSVAISHDIDHPFLYHGLSPLASSVRAVRRIAGDLTRRRSFATARETAAGYIGYLFHGSAADPYLTLNYLMETSERFGKQSTFFFIVDPSMEIDGRPYGTDPAIHSAIIDIARRGHAIGLHASYASFCAPTRAAREAECLRTLLDNLGVEPCAIGVRHHYLRWSANDHWVMWDDAGVAYDATLGFSDQAGFRCGTCHEFPTFDLAGRRQLKLVERPLLIMDVAVFPDTGIESRQAQVVGLSSIDKIVAKCRAYKGRLEILWHNSHLQSRTLRNLYLEALSCCLA